MGTTTSPPEGEFITSIRIDRALWDRFGEFARANRRTKGAQLTLLVERAVAEHENEQALKDRAEGAVA